MKKYSLFLIICLLLLSLLSSCEWFGGDNKTQGGSTISVKSGETYLVKNLDAGDSVSIVLEDGASIEFEDANVENSYVIHPNTGKKLTKSVSRDDGKIFWDQTTGEGILTPSKDGNRKISFEDGLTSSFDLVHNHHEKDFVITTDEMRKDLKNGIQLHREYYVADLKELEQRLNNLKEVAVIQKRGHLNYNYWDYGFTDESGKVVMNSNDNTIKGLIDLSAYKAKNNKLGVYNALRNDVLWTEDKSAEVNGESL